MSDQLQEEKFERFGRVEQVENLTTTDPNGAVKVRVAKEGIASLDPISVPDLVNRTVRDYPDLPAMVYKNAQKIWTTVTYRYEL